MRRVAIVLLCFLLLVCSAIPAAAVESSVTYEGKADQFVFSSDGTENPTNLFPEFTNVIPGDQLSQSILVKNEASKKVKVKVYLRSQGSDEQSQAFLSQLDMTVRKGTDTILYEGPADETGKLGDWTYLGTIYSGGEVQLDILLDVPASLESDFQSKTGKITWEFRVEERPVSSSDPGSPKTGDASMVYVYTVVMLLCILALLLLLRRKNHPETT